MRLKDKSIVITGAGSGLGREAALLFASEGARIVVTDKIQARVEKVVAEINETGGTCVGLQADVTLEPDMEAACRLAVEQFGQLDVMFANAGVPPVGFGTTPFEEFTEEAWDDVNNVVLKGVFFAAKHAVRMMKTSGGGNIVVTTSAAGSVAYPGFFAYGAGKAGANQLVKSLSLDLGRYNIRINALAPVHGMSVNFAMEPEADVLGLSYEEAALGQSGEPWDPRTSPIPLKVPRPPLLRDHALLALFLASDDSQYMSGVVIPSADGGTLSKVAMTFEESWEEDLAPRADSH